MKEIRNKKGAPTKLLDDIVCSPYLVGKPFLDILEERFGDTTKDWLKNMEQFVYQTCQTLYTGATKNITPFPPTWKGLLDELPFDNTKYDSFIEEYSVAKDEVIDNYRYNLRYERKLKKEAKNLSDNTAFIIYSLLDIVGTELGPEDLPPNFEGEEQYENLHKKLFFQRLRGNLGGNTFIRVFEERNLLERKLVQFFDTLYLPHDWAEQLTAMKEKLDRRENQIRNALNLTNDFENFDDVILWGRNWSGYQRMVTDKLKTLSKVDSTIPNAGMGNDWEKNLIHKADLGLSPADYGNIATIMNGKTLQELRTDSDWRTAHTCGGGVCPNPAHHTNYATLQTKNSEYDRIHAKLSGKVSDSELQTLLDAIPNCSHSDYDILKSERDTLKTENTQLQAHQCDCDNKVLAKEKEIINKIITDLELSREREREREYFGSRNCWN